MIGTMTGGIRSDWMGWDGTGKGDGGGWLC